MIGGIDHIGICVRNIDNLLPFYIDILGFEKILDINKNNDKNINKYLNIDTISMRIVMLKKSFNNKESYLELTQIIDNKNVSNKKEFIENFTSYGLYEICFEVFDLKNMYSQLLEKGIKFISEPQTVRFGLNKYNIVYTTDPEGVIIELFEKL